MSSSFFFILRALKKADADLMRLATSASEVRKWWMIEPRYSVFESMKSTGFPKFSKAPSREASSSEESRLGSENNIASFLMA
jgi:hypothetical protein